MVVDVVVVVRLRSLSWWRRGWGGVQEQTLRALHNSMSHPGPYLPPPPTHPRTPTDTPHTPHIHTLYEVLFLNGLGTGEVGSLHRAIHGEALEEVVTVYAVRPLLPPTGTPIATTTTTTTTTAPNLMQNDPSLFLDWESWQRFDPA